MMGKASEPVGGATTGGRHRERPLSAAEVTTLREFLAESDEAWEERLRARDWQREMERACMIRQAEQDQADAAIIGVWS